MKVQRPASDSESGFPSRAEAEVHAKSLGLVALSVGGLLAAGCHAVQPVREGGVYSVEPAPSTNTLAAAVRFPGEMSAGPRPQPVPETAGSVCYEVKAGDTLSGIASRRLGDAKRWPEIVKLNPGVKPDALQVGRKLVLPSADGRAK